MRQPLKNRNAGLAPGVGSGSGLTGWKASDTRTGTDLQAVLFSAVPRGTHWAAVAISPEGERVRLGRFGRRGDALTAARLMADIAGARWCP